MAICVQEAGKIITGLLSLRTPKLKIREIYQPHIESIPEPETEIAEGKATSIEAGCVPCVPPDALIWANPNVKEISKFTGDEMVLDHNGEMAKVINITSRQYLGELVSITVPGQNLPLLLTPEHLVLAIKGKGCKKDKGQTLCFPKENPKCTDCTLRHKYEPDYVPAGELSTIGKLNSWTKHILLMPRLKTIQDVEMLNLKSIANVNPHFIRNKTKQSIEINPDFMKLTGYYLAEGSVRFQRGGALLRFDFGRGEKVLATETVRLLSRVFNVNASQSNHGSTRRVYISSIILGHFFHNLFGSGARKKYIPNWMLNLPATKQASLLYGFWMGDGSWSNSYGRKVASATTCSRQLAYSLRLILHRLGILHHLGYGKTRASQIDGRALKYGEDQYIIQLNNYASYQLGKLFELDIDYHFVQSGASGIDDKWVYLPVKSMTRIPYKGTVMNIETSSQTYCVNGIIVHNCSIGHLGTCVGVMNEAMRFAKKEGLESSEVIDRVNICLDELNALERVDLRPEMIAGLPNWEKDLANEALSVSRGTRHSLENLSSVGELESVAAMLQTARQGVGRGWFKQRLARMNPEEKKKLSQEVEEKLKEVAEGRAENAG